MHSVHTTNRPGVIRILVTNQNAVQAKEFFGQLQVHLRASLSPEDVHIVTQGKQIQVTDRTYESDDSRAYAGYAAALLRENPQDGEPIQQDAISSPQRKKTRMEVTYSSMAKRALESSNRRNRNKSSNPDDSSTENRIEEENYGDNWEQKIQATFQSLFGDHPPLRAEDVEQKMQETINKQTLESEKRLDRRFATFSLEMKQFTLNENEKSKRLIQSMFERQNQLFLDLTGQMQENLLKLDENIKVMAMQTHSQLTHTEAPRIDVRKTSPVAQRVDRETVRGSDAPT